MTYTIAECTVNVLLMMDRGTVRNIQSFTPKIKFAKLVHLVGLIITKRLLVFLCSDNSVHSAAVELESGFPFTERFTRLLWHMTEDT